LLDPALAAAPEAVDDVTLALANHRKVDVDITGLHAVVRGAASEVGDAGAGDHRLGRGATFIDAGASNMGPLYQRCLPAGFSERPRQRDSCLPGSNHDRVVPVRRHRTLLHGERVRQVTDRETHVRSRIVPVTGREGAAGSPGETTRCRRGR
jgi:hypothetical protein